MVFLCSNRKVTKLDTAALCKKPFWEDICPPGKCLLGGRLVALWLLILVEIFQNILYIKQNSYSSTFEHIQSTESH